MDNDLHLHHLCPECALLLWLLIPQNLSVPLEQTAGFRFRDDFLALTRNITLLVWVSRVPINYYNIGVAGGSSTVGLGQTLHCFEFAWHINWILHNWPNLYFV